MDVTPADTREKTSRRSSNPSPDYQDVEHAHAKRPAPGAGGAQFPTAAGAAPYQLGNGAIERLRRRRFYTAISRWRKWAAPIANFWSAPTANAASAPLVWDVLGAGSWYPLCTA